MKKDFISIDDLSNEEVMEIIHDAFEYKSVAKCDWAQDKEMLGLFLE